MNPSATDWIPKFLNRFKKQELINDYPDENIFYNRLKVVGFIYGVSVLAAQNEPVSHLKLTKEEFTKINLFHALLFTFFSENPNAQFDDAFATIVDFYKIIGKGKTGFFQKLTLSNSPSNNLEQIMSARLHEANSLFKNNPTSLVTYALLYTDIIAFRDFLMSPENLKLHLDICFQQYFKRRAFTIR